MALDSIIPSRSSVRLNDGYEYREQLGSDAEGQTILAHLSARYAHSLRTEWEERIASGQVLINAHTARSETVLRCGDLLVWRRPPWVEPEAPCTFAVIYEDDELLAVDKPAGLPTLPGANFLQSTLLYRVQLCAPGATPLHRLGRWTSGLVLFARNVRARTYLTRQWSARTVGKRYRALVSGQPPWDAITVDAPIGPVPHTLLGSVHAASSCGKSAQSRVTVLERRADSCVCDVHIATGRAHQIRIHLAAAGYPLVGDPLYVTGGFPAPDSHAVPGDPGYHLHSAELSFLHPGTEAAHVITCAPPPLLRITRDANY